MKIKNLILSSVIISSSLFAGGNMSPATLEVKEIESTVITQNTWKSSASLYMFGAGISGETATQGEIDIPFEDIIDNLEMAFMANISFHNGKWGIESDFIYMNLGNEIDDNILINSFDFSSWVITPMVTYNLLDSNQLNINLLIGARYFSMEPAINNLTTSGDIWDAMVGIKGKYNINDRWFIPFHADIGGGDSDVTWQLFSGIGYRYDNIDIIAGYRHIDWSFDENHPAGDLFNDIAISGPMIGAKFNF